MYPRSLTTFVLLAAVLWLPGGAPAEDAGSLRLVPFPKRVELKPGSFALDRPLVLEAPETVGDVVAGLVGEELKRAGFGPLKFVTINGGDHVVRVRPADGAGQERAKPQAAFPEDATDEHYRLRVEADEVTVVGNGRPGMLHGVATLVQLVRANRRDGGLPCLAIDDWPSLRWRAMQDDITRGPSTRLDQLRRDVARAAALKLNVWTYYMQSQFAFTKHPKIGPPDGSLKPEELAALVEHAKPFGVHVLGNQQSFAHMQHVLALPEYAQLREDGRTLSPAKEETYELLDDLYGDVLPRLPFEFFNVCCDETSGLGRGPSKALAERVGPGGVYVQHVRRVYDLVHGKYGKRMMMWGDIILHHADKLDQIPKDVVMLTWGYGARESFEDQIVPFARSGYEFFVCPGVSCWSRVLPDFRCAETNIRNFVRDGAKHGALGMINTSWDDDGENLNAPNWYGFAWGAECAWNGAETPLEDFRRRLGPVLFGEPEGHFGQAIALLADPRVCGLMNRTFWADDPAPARPAAEAPARERLDLVCQAIEHLEACRQSATVDADLLDPVLFGARRFEIHNRRTLDRLEAARAYDEATRAKGKDAAAKLGEATAAVRRTRDAFAGLKDRWQELWLRENKPYALDWSLKRYDAAVARYDAQLEKLAAALKAAEQGEPLPPAREVGLALWGPPGSTTRPAEIESSLDPYQDYYRELAFDGDPATFFWSDRGLEPGDHFTLTLKKPEKLEALTILMGTDRYRHEYIHAGVLEFSTDGKTWQKLAELNTATVNVELPDEPLRALRLRAEKAQRYWLIIREIVLSGGS